MAEPFNWSYKPAGDTLKRFMKSDAFVRAVRGPIGSGKSVCCCAEIFRRSSQQKPDSKGIRRTRWAVIRNTSPELKTTTMKTWVDWFPEDVFGNINWTPPYTHHIQCFGLDIEVIFLALDRPEDVKKLLSLELTGVWVNEAREVPKEVVDAATSRVGRFPSMKDGGPDPWCGVIMDTNSPDDDHWWPLMSGEAPPPEDMTPDDLLMLQRPDNWEFFTQPPGMLEVFSGEGPEKVLTGYEINPQADNINNLLASYYPNLIRGKDKRWINIYVLNRLGATTEGRPIYVSFRPETHTAKSPLPIFFDQPVFVGLDFGLTPAAVFAQRVRDRWLIQREIVTTDMGAKRFAALIRRTLEEVYRTKQANITGDPAGDQRAQTDETTPFQILMGQGLQARPAHTNSFDLRVEAVEETLNRMSDGQPCFLVDPACRVLRKAMESGYCYRRLQVSGERRFADTPAKNRYSHVAEALQYLMLGGGEGRALIRPKEAAKPVIAQRAWQPWGRSAPLRG